MPTGIADAEIAPMLYSDGRPVTARGWYDTEAPRRGSGIALVAPRARASNSEVRLWKATDYWRADAVVPVPPEMGKLPSNKGIECLMVARKGSSIAGALIAISERGMDDAGNIRGFLIGGPKPGLFSFKPSDDFDVVDCAITPNSEVLILERYFSWRRGVAMRIRRVPLTDIVPGAVLEGQLLISADMGFQIDNMEGLSVHRAANGDTVLHALVSDDNFSSSSARSCCNSRSWISNARKQIARLRGRCNANPKVGEISSRARASSRPDA